jgi:DNA polymerase-1
MAIAIDTETHPFGPFNMAPKVVCLSWYTGSGFDVLVGDDIRKFMLAVFELGETIIGHNVAYDMACLWATFPELSEGIWNAYDKGLVDCTMVRQKLIAIAGGDVRWDMSKGYGNAARHQYSLAGLAKVRLNRELDKNDWRMRYRELEDVPIADWPKGARDYVLHDAMATFDIRYFQQKDLEDWTDLPNQVRAAWALHLVGVWGIRADKKKTVELYRSIDQRMGELRSELFEHEIVRANGKKNLSRIRELVEAELPNPPTTKKGATKTSKDVLEMCEHPGLEALVEYNGLEKTKSTYMEVLLKGIHEPIHATFDVLGANSGRTSCRGPNLQNQPRMPGVRECFIPSRPDWCFATADYDAQELRTLAQVCLEIVGESRLAERFQEDPDFDPHVLFATQVMDITYAEGLERKAAGDKEMKAMRQRAKAANFGFPGGMGAKKFRLYARGYGVELELDESEDLRKQWFTQWPEMTKYFAYINTLVGPMNEGTVKQIRSNRLRGYCGYTDAANSFFQGLAADSSKLALYIVCREAYSNTESPLWGWRPVNFVHDEIIMEGPESTAHEAAQELASLMQKAMAVYTPDVPARASPTLMRWWSKDAEPVFENGRLVPWEG